MAEATRAQALTTLKEHVELWDELDRFAGSNSDNWIAIENTVIESLEGDDAPAIIAAVRGDRSAISAILSPANIRAGLAPHMSELVTAIGKPHGSFEENMIIFRDNVESFPDTVVSRGITFDTSVTAAGTGC